MIAKKQHNGAVLRTNSLKSCTRSPPLERKSKLSALGRFFKPWKWRRKKKSEKFEEASKCNVQRFCKIFAIRIEFFFIYIYIYFPALERKISIRANREVLVQKGILLPESPINLGKLKIWLTILIEMIFVDWWRRNSILFYSHQMYDEIKYLTPVRWT